MRFFVLDLEWNISGKKQSEEQAEDKRILQEEIIEIGAVRLDSNMEPADRFSVDVKPRYHKKMHSYVGRLIRRESDSLKEGLPFPEAIAAFETWCGSQADNDLIFCTWSNSDSGPWLSNLDHYGLLPKHPPLFLDVQKLFALAEGEAGVQRSVAYALEYFELPLTEPFHRAVNDAYYTALILKKTLEVLTAEGKLPADPEKQARKLRSRAFDPSLTYKASLELTRLDSPEEAEEYLEGVCWNCPACGKPLEHLEPWKFKRKPFKRHTLAYCREHGPVRIRVTLYRDLRLLKQGHTAWKLRADLSVKRVL